jgi:hypothetical protein
MEYAQDIHLILNSLNKEKRELLKKLADIGKLIKRTKYGILNLGLNKVASIENDFTNFKVIEQPKAVPRKVDLKVQGIKIFDILGEASRLKNVVAKYKELTGINQNLR